MWRRRKRTHRFTKIKRICCNSRSWNSCEAVVNVATWVHCSCLSTSSWFHHCLITNTKAPASVLGQAASSWLAFIGLTEAVRQRYFPFLQEQNEGSTLLYLLQDILGSVDLKLAPRPAVAAASACVAWLPGHATNAPLPRHKLQSFSIEGELSEIKSYSLWSEKYFGQKVRLREKEWKDIQV